MDGCLLGEPIGRRPELPGPAPPGHPAARRPAPTRPWYVRVLDSTGLHRISLACAFEDTFRTAVLDALEGAKDSCLLGEPTRRHPVLPGSAPPRCPAVGRPDPTRPWYVRVLDSTSCLTPGCNFGGKGFGFQINV